MVITTKNINMQTPAYTITIGEIIDEFKKAKTRKDKKEVFKNRIAYLQTHAEAKSFNSNEYRYLKINFKNLIKMYESGDPDQWVWDTLGIVPWHIQQQREAQGEKDEKKSNTIH